MARPDRSRSALGGLRRHGWPVLRGQHHPAAADSGTLSAITISKRKNVVTYSNVKTQLKTARESRIRALIYCIQKRQSAFFGCA
jgi:hypothetical protein